MSRLTDRASVALIGCGHIGSRLLQSVAKVERLELSVEGFEPSAHSRDVAAARFYEARGDRRHTLAFPESVGRSYALGVVATDARNRLEALQFLAASGSVRRILLEKFLFTRVADYDAAAAILHSNGIDGWVNCSRNVWPGYASLKTRLAADPVQSFSVAGDDWSLACNGIHYLALVEYLCDSKVSDLCWVEGRPSIRDAKRQGYLELMGTLGGRTESGAALRLSSLPAAGRMIEVVVETERRRYTVREGAGTLTVEAGGSSRDEPFQTMMASELAPVLERIITEGSSTLPRYADSAQLHLKMMAIMNEGFHGSPSLEAECPVT